MTTLDALINKATDPTLTSDNWQYILDVCDKISSNPELETSRAVNLIKTKITSTKDANTILRSLSLLVSIAENCGSRMKQEIATKSFLEDCLIKKLSDRKLHITVKYRIIEVLEQLNKSFKSDPSLKPMNDAYNLVKSDYPQYFKAQQGPSKPAKQERTQQDKNKEDEELQRVLKLSLQEYENEQNLKKQYLNNKPLPESQQPQPQQEQQRAVSPAGSEEEQTVATVSKVRALYDLISYEEDELSFRKGDVITVIESVYRDWWRGSLPNGKIGIFPLNYVTPIVNKSPQELARENEMEGKLLDVGQKQIDRLLAILSTNDVSQIDEDEVTELYNNVISSRIQLGSFIDKYSVRQEELGVLNTQLNTEIKSYNELLDKSINNRSKQANGNAYNQLPYPAATHEVPQLVQQPQRQASGPQPQYQPPQQVTRPQPQYQQPQQATGPQPQYQQPTGSHPSLQHPTGQQQQYQHGPLSQPQFQQQQPSQPQFQQSTGYNAQYSGQQYPPYPNPQQINQQNTSAGFGNSGY
ncbi:Hse1 protein [Candida orthopsilosis Co 90-125]|uniref:Class E vacuolar protein-sorting machinery protein HSE1 n=1 Tax=Candida orthopsilosis (strain 90-125) TaxID=1136231 RepID=H8WW87_CANO9|nr:Hse1 protein [Candida orthopsilosis Co 90-125]CCG20711.1 Hse1 protein [Candida orthopsilosis Co 90-125]